MSKNKMTKDTIPEGFTWQLAIVDFLPVLFFGGTGIFLGLILSNLLVEIFSFLVFLSGLLKVIWKLIVVFQKKNIWFLFVQMRIIMPLGFVFILSGIIYSLCTKNYDLNILIQLPQLLFFIVGIIGIIGMIICSVKLDSTNPKSNWIEQIINSFAQGFIFIGVLLIFLSSH